MSNSNTYNAWNIPVKLFQKKIYTLKTLFISFCHCCDCLWGWAMCISMPSLKKNQMLNFWAWAETETGLFMQNKDKNMWPIQDPRQTDQSWRTQVSVVCHELLKGSCISNKLDTHHLRELLQHHQIISDPLPDQLKVGAIFNF